MLSFKNMLYAGFGLVILLIFIVGGSSYNALGESSDGFQTYRGLAKTTNITGRVQANLLMMRLHVKNYIISSSIEEKEQVESYLEKTRSLIDTSKREIKNPERLASIEKISDLLSEYHRAFKDVVQLKTTRNREVEQVLNLKGPEIEKAQSQLLFSEKEDGDVEAAYEISLALRHLLLARLYVVKFLDTNDQSSVERVQQEMKALFDNFDALQGKIQGDKNRQLFDEVVKNTKLYQSSFDTVVAAIFQRNDIIRQTLDRIGPQVATNIEDIKLSVKQEQDTLGPQLESSNQAAVTLILLIIGISVVVGAWISFYIVRTTLKQLGEDPRAVSDVVKQVALGDLDVSLPDRGEAQSSLYASMRNMVSALKQKAYLAQQIAAGDLSHDVTLTSDRDVLGKALQEMIDNLTRLLQQIRESSEQISVGSQQISRASQSLAEGAEEQRGSVEHISASLAELSSQTSLNAENASDANKLSVRAKEAIEQGQLMMNSMIAAMAEINESTQSIFGFIKTIDEIAGQTNLLALNAAIEAARAGEQGRGFAVVADEVRNLALRSTEAAVETAKLIDQAKERTLAGTKIAEDTSASLSEVFEQINGSADFVAQIAQASKEQAIGVDEAHQAVASIEDVTQINASASVESATSADDLSAQTKIMYEMLQKFKFNQS